MAQRNKVKCLCSKPNNNKISNIMKMWILMGFDEDEFRITEFLDENVVNPQPFPYV
jgi:hypothetical protein